MSEYTITIAVTTDVQLDDDAARDVAARWAAAAGLDLGMTSTARDEPWLRVSALSDTDAPAVDVAQHAGQVLAAELRTAGATVQAWQAVEVLSGDEAERRARRPAIPPLVSAAELAELAGLKSVQRIYQLESERGAGKRDDFPAPVVPGYWLRAEAEHWAANRRTKPGPAPQRDAFWKNH